MTKGNWIGTEDLASFLLIISNVAGYQFEIDDWNAVEYGLSKATNIKETPFTYDFTGESTIKIQLARDKENEDIVLYNLTFPENLEKCVVLAEYIISDFTLIQKHPL